MKPMIIAAVCIALSAAAFCLSTGLGTFWPAAWIAPLPILLFAGRAGSRTAFLAATAAFFFGGFSVLPVLVRVMPPPLLAVVLLLPSLVFAAAVLLARFASGRLPAGLAAFVFPAAWVTYEFLISRVSPHGTAGSLAYSQTDVLPLVQIASFTGIWGITFVIALIPSALAVAWFRRSARPLAPAFSILVGVLVFGLIRLNQRPAEPPIRVGLAATDRGVIPAFQTTDPALALSVANEYADRVRRLAAQGARVVVLPEKFVGVTPEDSTQIMQVFSDAARSANVTLVAGLNRIGLPAPRNVAAVFAPDGQLRAEYDKHHLLPGPETGYATGAGPGVCASPHGVWGVAICKDMDFPSWSRKYAMRGVTLLAVPAWDFVLDGRLHSRMAVMRAVENGFSLARNAQQGLLTISDAYGRVLAEAPSSAMPEALLVRDVQPGPGATLYTRYGDWFGWLNVLALAALLAAASLRS